MGNSQPKAIRDLRHREQEALVALAKCDADRTTLAEGLVAALKERDALCAALEPFAKMADSFDAYKGDDWETKQTSFHFTIGEFRRAKAALEQS